MTEIGEDVDSLACGWHFNCHLMMKCLVASQPGSVGIPLDTVRKGHPRKNLHPRDGGEIGRGTENETPTLSRLGQTGHSTA